MTIKLYKLHVNISGETDTSVEASSSVNDYPSLNITAAERDVAFTHFMDKEKCVEYLNLGRKLGSTQSLNMASGQGKTYAERNSLEQRQIYLNVTRAAFRCFLLAAKCANVNILSWNKLRRVMEVMTCISPGLPFNRYTDSVIVSPVWPTEKHGLWRSAIASLNIGSNTWLPQSLATDSGARRFGGSDAGWLTNITSQTRLRDSGAIAPHIRFGSQHNFMISADEDVSADAGMKYFVSPNHLTSAFLRSRYPVPVWPGDAHPFWFSKDPGRANEFMSVGAQGDPNASTFNGGVDGDPAERLIAPGVDLGYVDGVNQDLGHIPGIRGVPGVRRDIYRAYSGDNIMYEACGTIPFDWYTRLFYAPIPGLMPSSGADQQDLFVGTDYDSRPGKSIVDYILSIGVERWVCELKLDSMHNSQNFYDKMPARAQNSEGVLQYISSEIASLRSSDPGVAPIITAGGTAVTTMGGLIAKTGVGLIPGAVLAGVGMVTSLIGAMVGPEARTEQWKSFNWPVDVYGVPLAHDASGKNIANPTPFLAFRPTTGGAGGYVGLMSREFIAQGSVATILSGLPSDIQNLVAGLPSGRSGATPPVIPEPSFTLFAGYQPFPTSPTSSSKSVKVSLSGGINSFRVIATANGTTINDGDLLEPGKYKVSFSLAGTTYNASEMKLIEGRGYTLQIPDPPLDLVQKSIRDAQSSGSNSEGSSIAPWLIAGGIVAAGYYGWKKYGK